MINPQHIYPNVPSMKIALEWPLHTYGVNVGDGEKDMIVRGFWRRICGLFAEQIRKRWLYLIRL